MGQTNSRPAPSHGDASPSKRILVLGVDKGMTKTCAAYAFVEPGRDPRTIVGHEVHAIYNWPGKRKQDVNHIPTVVSYSRKDNSEGATGETIISIGYEAQRVEKRTGFKANTPESDVVVVRNFKILLDPRPQTADLLGEQEEGRVLRETLDRAKELGYVSDDLDVVHHFDTAVFSHCINQIRIERPDFDDDNGLLVTVALPYEWVDISAQKFVSGVEKAVHEAGVRNFVHVLPFNESQASAEGVLKQVSSGILNPNDLLLSVDCGGATIDAVINEIQEVAPIKISKRASKPESRKSSSTHINTILEEEFWKVLTPKRAEIEEPSEGVTLRSIIGGRLMSRVEEDIKPVADPSEPQTLNHYIDIRGLKPDPENHMIEKGKLVITKKHLEPPFRQSMSSIIELLESQVGQIGEHRIRLKAIVLTGGYANSPWTSGDVKAWATKFSRENNITVHFMKARESGSMVAIGLVLQGCCSLGSASELAKARFNIGCMYSIPAQYNMQQCPEISPLAKWRRKDTNFTIEPAPKGKGRYIANLVKYIITKGDMYSPDEPLTLDYEYFFYESETTEIRETLVMNHNDCVKDLYPFDSLENADPVVFDVAELLAGLKFRGSEGKRYQHFRGEVRISVRETTMQISLKAWHNNKTIHVKTMNIAPLFQTEPALDEAIVGHPLRRAGEDDGIADITSSARPQSNANQSPRKRRYVSDTVGDVGFDGQESENLVGSGTRSPPKRKNTRRWKNTQPTDRSQTGTIAMPRRSNASTNASQSPQRRQYTLNSSQPQTGTLAGPSGSAARPKTGFLSVTTPTSSSLLPDDTLPFQDGGNNSPFDKDGTTEATQQDHAQPSRPIPTGPRTTMHSRRYVGRGVEYVHPTSRMSTATPSKQPTAGHSNYWPPRFQSSHKNNTVDSSSTQIPAPTTGRSSLTDDERKRFEREGRCNYCRQVTTPPHRALECPLNSGKRSHHRYLSIDHYSPHENYSPPNHYSPRSYYAQADHYSPPHH
ncbi:hypothetical protein K491DRAFT_718714 [Lophiostoma macrostomum CBS 122681]|uniref:Actin-like ATPase domain-containing protein n=1 Tax=Lophiostoma macrostomum CBS 122681 TaxID=1314788 RepID=A0A6A6T2B1_9PLEO|nr:hypothetical protein K491DRAFT_718714 [Lophiostoma macrostomum CBS 122681]